MIKLIKELLHELRRLTMAIEKKATGAWFHEGAGGGYETHTVIEHDEIHEEMTKQTGAEVNENGAKPEFATGSEPFYHGSGAGRGHSVESK